MCSLYKETRLVANCQCSLEVGSWRCWELSSRSIFAATPVEAAGRAVSFRSDDGRTINALVFEPSQRPSAAVVLVPMLGRPKDDWDAVGQRLADANILALAIDLPGLSDPGDSSVLGAWSGDVRAAVMYLLSRPDVRPGAIGIAGASLGASLAAMAAAGRSGGSLAGARVAVARVPRRAHRRRR